jgi:predicted enzyme related to lactoylglutathione lyase
MTSNKVTWFEVLGKNADRLRSFYAAVFDWSFKSAPGMDYGMTDPEATGIGGGVGSAPGNADWTTFYVGVEDVEKSLDKAKKLGATVLMPVTRLPDVTIAVFADPEAGGQAVTTAGREGAQERAGASSRLAAFALRQ